MADLHLHEAAETFPAEPESVTRARHWVRSTIEGWGLDGNRREIELLTTELSANAVLHARSDFEVCISSDGEVVRVEVTDRAPDLPQPKHPANPEALGGRGLLLVEQLSQRSGVAPRDPGKSVWFEIEEHRRSALVG